MNIEFNVLDRQFNKYQQEYEQAALEVLRSGWYILGKQGEAFEKEFAEWNGSTYCIGLNSGLDALTLAFRALGIGEGDEVIVPANTYIASVMGITLNGATPIFIEPDEYFNINSKIIEGKINSKTKAILAVHLYGQLADIEALATLTKKNKIYLVEDCAQAHGAMLSGKKAGTFGDIGCFSFFPTKNLGAFGDAGAIVTNHSEFAEKVRTLRNYGSNVKYYNELLGVNSRLDEIQAALLRVKLKHLDELTKERQEIAKQYLREIKNELIKLPQLTYEEESHVFHLFVVQTEKRERLQAYLTAHGIKTQIHYPIPPHLAECYAYLGHKKGDLPISELYSKTILSLPLYNGMTNEEIQKVIGALNQYKG